MTLFWLILLLLLVAAVMLFVCAGWRLHVEPQTDRAKLNKIFYQQRLQELQRDDAEGLLSGHQDMVGELQQTLLDDIPPADPPPATTGSRWLLFPGVLLLILVSAGCYLKTGGLLQLLQWKQVQDDLPALRAQLMDPQARPLTMAQLSELGLGLRSALQQTPQNVNDWMMLGRIGMVLNDAQTARQAFEKALRLQPENQQLRLNYVEVLVRSPDPQDNREASGILQDMLQQDGNNIALLGLAAVNAYSQQQYVRAIKIWQQMLTLLPENDKQTAMIESSIEQAKTQAGQQNSWLSLKVSLAAAAKTMLPPQGVLYISVSDGVSPVPVAVKRMPLSHFPVSLRLDDSDAMIPERLLSAQHQIQVRARISRDGHASPQSGDWIGTSAVMPFDGHQQLAVEINQQQP
ncbi:c-type cytochrome biogenesis protein CcmI [Erwinia sp. OLTSP20]|uniref:c-type cytochrome biogenesis protein CcmI n=1 Tax=unclassified Erwinia TaxID=2622719 RepID=UPI000C1A5524|nr:MULTISPECIES: c-type cytochrome biogenesis protein CcmI [unclassified Erwinia]PIJ51531.1 c-type cytochrome biogenesis protein CcmI [Erwinia sp. OAMSP11]PIJ75883.1 c-type cytochrome biogenesis protein CcmI [Erwinia sp. OLSSP12]PIJ83441.1 c-type cytochrome biogenesis protein CcmI [Erwinia sp. OLCASP19]PIJ86274.1 c-type cytochrome biogenesis protein CcmI [Erwinia sp. OLMTSP26]PIJ88483.1 c-type cytochrome biogenesis protein CcmI [Erwinia sp. OLMDSP33]